MRNGSGRRVAIQLSAWLLFVSTALLGARLDELRRFASEAEAVAEGRRLQVGSVGLEGPQTVPVYSHQTWTLVYTAGKAGVQPGGGIRIAMRHLHNWSPPQTKHPKEAGYLTVKAPAGVRADVTVHGRARELFSKYFPWQHLVDVTVPEQGLAAGRTIQLTYGDRSGGGPGMRIQPFDEPRFVFKCYVDALGNGDFLPLADNPAVEIVGAEPCRLGIVMPSDVLVGKPAWCIVRAEDRYGNPTGSYRGTARFESTDPDARLPAEYTFTADDRGVHRFEDVEFRTAGTQTLTVGDGRLEGAGNPVQITRTRPEHLLLWGDIHGHTLYSDGRGTVEEFYKFGRDVAGLDFCAVTDHAFEVLDEMWIHSKRVTNRFNEPGRFVTFQAFEWSGLTSVGGDHNVYFLEDDPPIYRSPSYYDPRNSQMVHSPESKVNHVTDLFTRLSERMQNKDIFCIPHYGGRRGNPKWHDPKVQRMIEIFSEHRRSEDWATTFLEKGYRLGVMASTDGHFGNPGYGYLKPSGQWDKQEIGMAALAVYAPERTRKSIFRALYDRRVYATSGDRIILDFRADGKPMGSEIRTAWPPVLTIEAEGTAAIQRVEIKKNSKTVHVHEPEGTKVSVEWRDPDFRTDEACYYYVRVLQADNEEAISSPIWVN